MNTGNKAYPNLIPLSLDFNSHFKNHVAETNCWSEVHLICAAPSLHTSPYFMLSQPASSSSATSSFHWIWPTVL